VEVPKRRKPSESEGGNVRKKHVHPLDHRPQRRKLSTKMEKAARRKTNPTAVAISISGELYEEWQEKAKKGRKKHTRRKLMNTVSIAIVGFPEQRKGTEQEEEKSEPQQQQKGGGGRVE